MVRELPLRGVVCSSFFGVREGGPGLWTRGAQLEDYSWKEPYADLFGSINSE